MKKFMLGVIGGFIGGVVAGTIGIVFIEKKYNLFKKEHCDCDDFNNCDGCDCCDDCDEPDDFDDLFDEDVFETDNVD